MWIPPEEKNLSAYFKFPSLGYRCQSWLLQFWAGFHRGLLHLSCSSFSKWAHWLTHHQEDVQTIPYNADLFQGQSNYKAGLPGIEADCPGMYWHNLKRNFFISKLRFQSCSIFRANIFYKKHFILQPWLRDNPTSPHIALLLAYIL